MQHNTKFDTKFVIGETVSAIRRIKTTEETAACHVCDGKGYVEAVIPNFGRADFPCPRQRRNGKHEAWSEEVLKVWEVDRIEQPIIRIDIRQTQIDPTLRGEHPDWKPFDRDYETYVLAPDTLTSWYTFPIGDVFSDLTDAQDEVDRRNGGHNG
jgi:hypothetical protein